MRCSSCTPQCTFPYISCETAPQRTSSSAATREGQISMSSYVSGKFALHTMTSIPSWRNDQVALRLQYRCQFCASPSPSSVLLTHAPAATVWWHHWVALLLAIAETEAITEAIGRGGQVSSHQRRSGRPVDVILWSAFTRESLRTQSWGLEQCRPDVPPLRPSCPSSKGARVLVVMLVEASLCAASHDQVQVPSQGQRTIGDHVERVVFLN